MRRHFFDLGYRLISVRPPFVGSRGIRYCRYRSRRSLRALCDPENHRWCRPGEYFQMRFWPKMLDMVLTNGPFCSENDHLHLALLPSSTGISRRSSSNSGTRPLVFAVWTGKDLLSHSEYSWEISPIRRRPKRFICCPNGTP